MEADFYSDLKSRVSSVPAKAMNYRSRMTLANFLNIKQEIKAESGYARDYRGFAEQMGFQYNDSKMFEQDEDPTMKILDSWETDPDATLDKLIEFLEAMERYDVIKKLAIPLKADVETYLKAKQKKEVEKKKEIPVQVPEVTSCPVNLHYERDLQLFTRDDVMSGEYTYYDAYMSYADADIEWVCKLAKFLESPPFGLKLFIRDRNMLAGVVELDIDVTLIKERCRRMLIVLTPNYLTSPSCEFQTSFAASLAIDQSKRMLIPVIIEECEIPPILKYVSKIDFSKPGNVCWVYARLINSLLPEGSTPVTISTIEKCLNQGILPPRLGSSNSTDNPPAIAFHPPTNQLCLSDGTSSSEFSYAQNSPRVQSKTKKWYQLTSHFKKARISSNGYSSDSSSSSNATSGFHSQSCSTIENIDGSVEVYSDKTSL